MCRVWGVGLPKIQGTFFGGFHTKDYVFGWFILGSLFRETTIRGAQDKV